MKRYVRLDALQRHWSGAAVILDTPSDPHELPLKAIDDLAKLLTWRDCEYGEVDHWSDLVHFTVGEVDEVTEQDGCYLESHGYVVDNAPVIAWKDDQWVVEQEVEEDDINE